MSTAAQREGPATSETWRTPTGSSDSHLAPGVVGVVEAGRLLP